MGISQGCLTWPCHFRANDVRFYLGFKEKLFNDSANAAQIFCANQPILPSMFSSSFLLYAAPHLCYSHFQVHEKNRKRTFPISHSDMRQTAITMKCNCHKLTYLAPNFF
uniref:Uncharacterized protein n=1 Tax=Anguilla anguilla TaxID=7936 RepID=A0A0E9WXC9_ANGAN